jgi:hypothetical protein
MKLLLDNNKIENNREKVIVINIFLLPALRVNSAYNMKEKDM